MSTLINPIGYCDVEDLQNFLLLDIDPAFEPQINTWIASAERWVNNYLGYTTASGILAEQFVNVTEDTATVDSEGNLIVFPRKTPIISVQAVTLIKGTETVPLTLTNAVGVPKYQIPEDGDMFIYPGYELALTGSTIFRTFMNIRFVKFYAQLSYIAGYTQIPADIHMATVNVVSDFITRHANKDGLSSIKQGDISKTWKDRDNGESDFIADAKTLLAPYRISTSWIRK